MASTHKAERAMKRLDNGKTSLVEFMAAIKFARPSHANAGQLGKQFAGFDQRARPAYQLNLEDAHLIRSAN
jgi:hypothetical protein